MARVLVTFGMHSGEAAAYSEKAQTGTRSQWDLFLPLE